MKLSKGSKGGQYLTNFTGSSTRPEMTSTFDSFFQNDLSGYEMNQFEILITSPDVPKPLESVDSAVFVSRSNSIHARMDAFFGDDIPMSPIKSQPFNYVPNLPVIQDSGDDDATDALLKELLFIPSYDCSMISDACDDNSSLYSLDSMASNDSLYNLGLLNLDSFQETLEQPNSAYIHMPMSAITSNQFPESGESYQTYTNDMFSAMNTPIEERFTPYPEFQTYRPNPYSGSYPVFAPRHSLAPILETPLLDDIYRSNLLSVPKPSKQKKLSPLITTFPGQYNMRSARSAPIKVPYIAASKVTPPTISPSGNFKCEFCPKEFTRAQNLKTHMMLHYPSASFPCTDCQSTFRRLPDLRRHYKSVHMADKQFMCPHGCGKAFSRRDALKRHLVEKSQGVCAALRLTNAREF